MAIIISHSHYLHVTFVRAAVAKMTHLRLLSSYFHKYASGSGALGFHESGSGSSSGFCLFSHINFLIILVCLKLNGK